MKPLPAEHAIADALLTETTDEILSYWRKGLDTEQIGRKINRSEAFVYNWLSAARSRASR